MSSQNVRVNEKGCVTIQFNHVENKPAFGNSIHFIAETNEVQFKMEQLKDVILTPEQARWVRDELNKIIKDEVSMKDVNDQNFKEEIQNNKLVVVDFWAEWCGSCKALAPVYEELSKEHPEITFLKCDVDQSGESAQRYGIRGIPTLLFFKDGEVKSTLIGNQPKGEIHKNLMNLK